MILAAHQIDAIEAMLDELRSAPVRVSAPQGFEAALAATAADLDALVASWGVPRDDPYAPREDGVGAEVFVSDPYPGEDELETVDVNDGEDFRDLAAYDDAREGVL